MILGFAMLRLPLAAAEQSSCIANRVLLEDLGPRVCRAASERPTSRKSLATQSMIIAAVITWGSSVCEGRQPTGSNVSPGIQHSSRDQVLCVMAYGLHCIISKKITYKLIACRAKDSHQRSWSEKKRQIRPRTRVIDGYTPGSGCR